MLAAKSPRIVIIASDEHRLSGIRFLDCNFDVDGAWIFCSAVMWSEWLGIQ